MENLIYKIIKSWSVVDSEVNSTESLFHWIQELNESTYVNINECDINDSAFWFYDDYNGEILNRRRSFFSVKGMRYFVDNQFVCEQPIIVQPEIGYLGIIGKEINGVLHFLMQAKIEPGNINCVQISPTIQATKSNFTRAHGGNLPTYFELFEKSEKYDVIYDQIQSEQSARFYKKRNRNMIMIVNEEFEIFPNFKWMTLGQIKQLMDVDNLVNMDTRTVLSGIPFVTSMIDEECKRKIRELFTDKPLYESLFNTEPQEYLPKLFQKINNYKMFKDIKVATVPLNQLVDWTINENGITCNKSANFMVRFYDIEISGREVQHWTQPLFKAIGKATFGLITKVVDGKRLFLVKVTPEIGSFDKIEVGPTVQLEPMHKLEHNNVVEMTFFDCIRNQIGIMCDVYLSEEGGRFYHEENRNVIIEVDNEQLSTIPDEYMWVSLSTLNYMMQTNNLLNIQLRNLLSLLKL